MTHDAMFDRRLLAQYQRHQKAQQHSFALSANGNTPRDDELERVVRMLEGEIRTYWQILDRATKETEEETNATSATDSS